MDHLGAARMLFLWVLVETAGDEALYKNSGKHVALLFVPTSVSKKAPTQGEPPEMTNSIQLANRLPVGPTV